MLGDYSPGYICNVGLTIHYELTVPNKWSIQTVQEKLEALRQACLDLLVAQVSNLQEFTGDECEPGEDKADPFRWAKIQSGRRLDFGHGRRTPAWDCRVLASRLGCSVMGKRKRRRPKAIVDRLPIRPPFARDEWGKMHVSDLKNNPTFVDYYERCFKEVLRSGRVETYLTRLAGMMHVGRLEEFSPRSYDKFFEEAEQQRVSVPNLEMALDLLLQGLAEQQIVLNHVEQFEFLSFAGDFANRVGEDFGMTERLRLLAENATAAGIMSLVVAINDELRSGS